MRLRPRRFLVSAFLLAISLANELNAQTTTSGALTGVVTDPSHAVVPDASVEIKDNAKGTTESTRTDREGVYRFFFLAPSSYVLTVTHPGFRKESRAVTVLLGPPGTVNVTLEIAKTSSEITVTGEAPLIQAENGDVSTTMNQRQISEVPNPGNDLTYIAQTAPGAIMATEPIPSYMGNFSILGMPATSNLFTLNGMNNNNMQSNTNNSGALGMLLGQNEVQEASVVSHGYSGQYGGAAGSNINYVTKSGGNAFHGNAAYYWNGRVLNANDWIDNAEGNPRPFTIANQWAGSLGGPIVKDKLFFFFDTEGMHLVLPYPNYVVLPSAAFESATMANINSIFGPTSASSEFYQQIFNVYNGTPGASQATAGSWGDALGCWGWTNPNDPTGLGVTQPCAVHFSENLYHPSSESMLSGRVDWNIGRNDRVFLLVQYDHGQRATYIDPINSVFNAFTNQPWWQGQLSETHTISSSAANQFLLAGTYINQTTSVANPAQTQAVFPTVLNWNNSLGGFSTLGGDDWLYAMPAGSQTTTYQISDDLVKIRGKHKLGVGVNFLRTDLSGFGYNWSGTGQIAPQTINAFFYGGLAPSTPLVDFTTLWQSYPAVISDRYAFYSLGLYGQEEWRARPNLALTLAFRADHQSNPVCERHCYTRLSGSFDSISHDPNQPYNQILRNYEQAFRHTDSIVWSPRFSFAWQPLGVSHHTVLRGGIGIFYDPLPGALASTFTSNPPAWNVFFVSGYNLAPGQANSLFQNAAASNSAVLKAFASGQTLAQIQAVDPNFSPPGLQTSANTLHSPQFQKWSLQAQQSFGGSTSLSIGYFGNHGIHEFFMDQDVNGHNWGPYPTAPCASPPVAPCYDSRFSSVIQDESGTISNYNGMVVSFEQRVTRWGSGLLRVNYTYGHALDEVSNGGLGQFNYASTLNPQNANNLRGSYGAADYDVRHSLNANYVWEVPVKEALGGHGPASLVKGWQVSGTVFARTGFPYSVTDGAEGLALTNDNIFNTIYSVPVAPLGPTGPCGKGAAIPAAPVPCLPSEVLESGAPNPGALFLQAGCETGFTTGNLGALGPSGTCPGPAVNFAQGRNHFRGPNYVNTDLALMKNTKIAHWENGVLTIGFQFFNLLNHANFGLPNTDSSTPTLGEIFYEDQPPTSILGSGLGANVSARMIQLKAQIRF